MATMRRCSGGVGNSNGSLSIKHHHHHDTLHATASSPSTSRPHAGPTGQPTTISDFSAKTPPRRRNRKWAPRNHRGRPWARKSGPGCSNPDVGSLSVSERAEEIESMISTKDENHGEEEVDVNERLQELVGFGCVEEPELSDDSLMINSLAQQDELLAMESIYGDCVLKLDRLNGLQAFQVHIEIEARDGISLTAKLDSSGDQKAAGNGENTDDFSCSFNVHYLPPIVLTCALPKSYPSHRPPYFTISTQWLDPINTSKLCSMLDYVWNEQSGREVIYQWVEWLSSSSLSYLGFQNEIMLGPYGTRHAEDKRAISGIVSPEKDVPLIRRYNDERLHENFQQSLHECCICFSEYPGTEFARLPCGHFFCLKCMKTFSDIHVKEGNTNKLRCPETKCGSMIPPSLLKQLLSQEEYQRWEAISFEKTLESMSDIAYCPRCSMPCIEEKDNYAQCPQCFFCFCTMCWDRLHIGEECITPEERLRILQERKDSPLMMKEQRRRVLDKINEIMSMDSIRRSAKQCPSCKMAISRIEGCNKMVCENCGAYFCYRCNQAIKGYDHFSGKGSCKLFPDEERFGPQEHANPRNEEPAMNRRQAFAQARNDLFGGQGQV